MQQTQHTRSSFPSSKRPSRWTFSLMASLATVVWVLISAGTSLAADTATEGFAPIVEKAIEFHGGGAYLHSTTELDMCSLSGCFHVSSTVDGDAFEYRVSGMVKDTHIKVEVTNSSVRRWFDGVVAPIPAGDEQRYRDWAMQRLYFSFLPYRLTDPGVRHKDLGIVDWEGRKLHAVEVSFVPGSSTDASDKYRYWFDPKTGQVELFAYSYEGEPGGLRFRRAINSRREGGILFFDQENLGVEGEGLKIEDINPTFVREQMRPVSKVKLRHIRVTPLP